MSTPNLDTSAEDNMTETIEVTIPDQKTAPIPLFLKKLWKMVNDTNGEEIIGWNSTGDGFIIYDQVKFVTELLPTYFKHNNLSSFIRQLNFYDFHKVANVDKHEMEFAHSCFLKDLPETLAFITRKVPNVKSRAAQGIKQENINEVLMGVKELRSKHNLIDNELKMLKQENAALWSEINSLRIKYSKQTKVINKLIHFLISYMHSHQNTFGKTNITTVSRKLDQKHLKNTPQLFQIDYFKSPNSSGIEKKIHLKTTTSDKIVTAPTTIKNTAKMYYNQPKLLSKKGKILKDPTVVASKKYPLTKLNSYPMGKNPENFPKIYNVSSPVSQQSVFPKSPYPIEEIVTEVDPLMEETSVYTVKFPKSDINSKQNQSSLPVPELISQNVVSARPVQSQPITFRRLEVPSKNEGKLTHGKRKINDSNLAPTTTQKPKITNTSQRKQKTLKLIIPKPTQIVEGNKKKTFKQPMPKSKKKANHFAENSFYKETQIPQPSPVKPDVVLENLFSEIGNPGTSQSNSSILSELPSNLNNLGLHFVTDHAELISEDIQDSGNLKDVANSPSDTLSAQSVDPGGPLPSEEILPFTTDQENLESETQLILKGEPANHFETDMENNSDRMFSSFSDIPEAHSPSREILKYNIIENPKENLGLYLDNTQIQLSNIQDLLNDLNSEELFDLLGCFNVDEEDENAEQRGNQILGANDFTN